MKKILIIDDELLIRETLSQILILLNFTVFEAKDGLEGLEKVKINNPDLIVCDINMPVLDGYGFILEHIKSNFSKTPVLFLSAHPEFKVDGALAGAKACLKKPFTIEELKKTINYCLNL